MEMVELAKYYLKIDFNSLSSIFCQIFVFSLILERIVSDVDCIVNNGNILTKTEDGNVIISSTNESVGENKDN